MDNRAIRMASGRQGKIIQKAGLWPRDSLMLCCIKSASKTLPTVARICAKTSSCTFRCLGSIQTRLLLNSCELFQQRQVFVPKSPDLGSDRYCSRPI